MSVYICIAGRADMLSPLYILHRTKPILADKLARQASAMPLLGPEPAVGIPRCSPEKQLRTGLSIKHYSAWKDLPGHTDGKHFTGRPCKGRAEDLLKLSRHQLKMAVAVLTGHAPVRRHLYTMGLFDGVQPADFAGWRLQQCSVLFAAARCWLASAVMSLGSCLPNQKL
jgi:hypothetical protein